MGITGVIHLMGNQSPPICNYEGSDYQTSFWDQGERSYEDQVEAIALRRLLPDSGKRILELGAGAGRNTPRYKAFEQVVLLDYARSQLEQAQERLGSDPRFTYVVADIYHLPFVPGLFDAATMIRTIHHMADAPQALQQIHQVMRDGAVFILEYASKHNLKAIFRYLLRRQEWSPFSPEPVEFADLNFDFHPAMIRDWLRQSGFQVQRQITVSHFRLGILKRLLPLSLLVRLDAMAQRTGDLWQLSPSVFVRAGVQTDLPPAAAGTFFCCPVCLHFPLEETDKSCNCTYCGREWPIENGIYIFRRD